MSNRKRIASIAFTGAAAAAAVGMNAAPAAAASSTWKVNQSNGTHFTGKNVTSATLNTGGVNLTCSTSNASAQGQVSGNGVPYVKGTPEKLGTISVANFGINRPCSLDGFGVTAKVKTGPFAVNGSSYNAASGVAKGSITNISASINGSSNFPGGCHVVATNVGVGSPLPGSFRDASKQFWVNTGDKPALRIKSVSGCLGAFAVGESAWFSAKYSTNPGLSVTAGT